MCCWTVTYLRKMSLMVLEILKRQMKYANSLLCSRLKLRIFMLPNCSSCPTLMQCMCRLGLVWLLFRSGCSIVTPILCLETKWSRNWSRDCHLSCDTFKKSDWLKEECTTRNRAGMYPTRSEESKDDFSSHIHQAEHQWPPALSHVCWRHISTLEETYTHFSCKHGIYTQLC